MIVFEENLLRKVLSRGDISGSFLYISKRMCYSIIIGNSIIKSMLKFFTTTKNTFNVRYFRPLTSTQISTLYRVTSK